MKALGWRNFHYKSKFPKISFNPLPSTWILHFPNKRLGKPSDQPLGSPLAKLLLRMSQRKSVDCFHGHLQCWQPGTLLLAPSCPMTDDPILLSSISCIFQNAIMSTFTVKKLVVRPSDSAACQKNFKKKLHHAKFLNLFQIPTLEGIVQRNRCQHH
jgi:hypothetical protein